MPLRMVKNSIIKMEVDAIVNPTDYKLSGSGSIDAKIRAIGGDDLAFELKKHTHCNFGEVVVTKAYNLNACYLFHTVGPYWNETENPCEVLKNCYLNCLNQAVKLNLKSIAFPLIATGSFNFPKTLALEIAMNVFNAFLLKHELDVYLVLYTVEALGLSQKLFADIEILMQEDIYDSDLPTGVSVEFYELHQIPLKQSEVIQSNTSLNDTDYKMIINEYNEHFVDKLLDIIERYKFKKSAVYHAAEVDKVCFNNWLRNYTLPDKKNALLICLALPINLNEATELLASAGYAFNCNNLNERLIKYLITNKNIEEKKLYDVKQLDLILALYGKKSFVIPEKLK